MLAALAVTLVLAVLAAAVAVQKRDDASDSALTAVARQVGAAALVEDALDRSLLLAVAAVRLEDSAETRGDLLAALERSPAARRVLRGDGDRLLATAVTGDGRYLVVGDNSGTIVTWDLRTGRRAGAVQATPNGFTGISARPGGHEVVLGSLAAEGFQTPLTVRWDAEQQQTIGAPLGGADTPVGPMAWSADGRYLAGAQDVGDVLVWDFAHPDRAPVRIPTNDDRFRTIAAAAGGRFVVVEASGSAAVWTPGRKAADREFDIGAGVSAVAGSPDGSLLAVGHENGAAALWDPARGRLRQQLNGHTAMVQEIVFDPEGRSVATLGDDREVVLSDARSGELRERFTGHSGRITSGAFAGDGRTLYTASLDSSVIAWDVTGERRLGALFPGSSGTESSWTTVSGPATVAVAREDGSVRFWDGDTGRALGPAVGSPAGIIAASFSPDGDQLATAGLRRSRPALGRRQPDMDRARHRVARRRQRGRVQPRRATGGGLRVAGGRRDDPPGGRRAAPTGRCPDRCRLGDDDAGVEPGRVAGGCRQLGGLRGGGLRRRDPPAGLEPRGRRRRSLLLDRVVA